VPPPDFLHHEVGLHPEHDLLNLLILVYRQNEEPERIGTRISVGSGVDLEPVVHTTGSHSQISSSARLPKPLLGLGHLADPFASL
jgi:hypothetical protein